MSEKKVSFLLIAYQTKRSVFYVIIPVLLISYLVGLLYFNLDPLLSLFPSGENETSFQLLEGVIMVSTAAISGFLIVLAIKKHLIYVSALMNLVKYGQTC